MTSLNPYTQTFRVSQTLKVSGNSLAYVRLEQRTRLVAQVKEKDEHLSIMGNDVIKGAFNYPRQQITSGWLLKLFQEKEIPHQAGDDEGIGCTTQTRQLLIATPTGVVQSIEIAGKDRLIQITCLVNDDIEKFQGNGNRHPHLFTDAAKTGERPEKANKGQIIKLGLSPTYRLKRPG